ncbi:hypothetical protein R1flu_003340 [Riccia fluitans]|uniref:Uncharacterized protein n=1 Tax=Riccia fluitans TaxID=41844 RepID=A0ABD1Y9A6_9MARC
MVKSWAAAAAGLSILQLVAVAVQGAYSPHLVNFGQYAGYVTVNKTHGRHQFYWFITADHEHAASLSLAIWLSGGMHAS